MYTKFKVLDEWYEYIFKNNKIMDAVKSNGNADLIFPNSNGEIRSYSRLSKSFKNFLKN